MIHEAATAADIIEGVHFRDTIGAERTITCKGVYLRSVLHLFPTGVRNTYSLRQGGREWGQITPSGVLVRKGYAWNYCTASPDWQKAASGPHDLLYQFAGCLWFPSCIDRHKADDVFRKFSSGRSSWAFSLGLRLGSWACWGRKPEYGETVVVLTDGFDGAL